jgi:hypothetical protein
MTKDSLDDSALDVMCGKLFMRRLSAKRPIVSQREVDRNTGLEDCCDCFKRRWRSRDSQPERFRSHSRSCHRGLDSDLEVKISQTSRQIRALRLVFARVHACFVSTI